MPSRLVNIKRHHSTSTCAFFYWSTEYTQHTSKTFPPLMAELDGETATLLVSDLSLTGHQTERREGATETEGTKGKRRKAESFLECQCKCGFQTDQRQTKVWGRRDYLLLCVFEIEREREREREPQ